MKQYWNKTKVICTIGPACNQPRILKEMIVSGMDMARLNFSHGQLQQHGQVIKSIKSLTASLKSPVAILQDLPGPKIRIGLLQDAFIELKQGQTFLLTAKKIMGTSFGVSINNALFVQGLRKNSIVYLNDGLVKLVVMSKKDNNAICQVLSGGKIYPRKGVSCPGQILNLDSVTNYDLRCLRYGINLGIDFVAVSFVQHAKDILKVKDYLKRKAKHIFVIAKIERKVALDDIDQIIKAADAVMIARGDLGIEAKLADIPFLQKEIISKANALGKPVITATQMLESMVNNPQPTRAEVTDIANAVLDGTDALMLSEETAIGKYPVECLRIMLEIASKTESKLSIFSKQKDFNTNRSDDLIEAFSYAAVNVAAKVKAKAIIVPTQNANAIACLSRQRPEVTIVGLTNNKDTYKKLILYWGVYPVIIKGFGNLAQTLKQCVQLVRFHRIAKKNDNVVIMLTKDNRLYSSNIMEVRKIS